MSGEAKGWNWPLQSRKAHYFDADGRALCGKWLWLGPTGENDKHDSPDNCMTCRRKLAAKLEKEASAL